jgi:hypothetical protein
VCFPKRPHLPLLVRLQYDITARLRRTQQHETRLAILAEIRKRSGLIVLPLHKPGGARQAPPLVTNGRQLNTRPQCSVPYEFILSAKD